MAQKYKSKWTGPQVDEAIGNVSKKIDKDSLIGSDGITINKTDSTIEISGTELVKKTTEANKVYGTDSTGEQALKPLVNTPTPFALAVYNDVSNLKTSVSVEDLDCTNRKYADDNFINKLSPTPNYFSAVIYSPTQKIYTGYKMENAPQQLTMPYRDTKGNFKVGDITADDDGQYCANKKYVDDANKDLYLKFTNLEQALYGYILDTTKEAYADLDSAVLKNSVAVGDNVYPIADKTRALVSRIEGKTTKMVQLLDKSVIPATKTVNGITYTNNNDGSVTINGTATNEAYIIIVTRDKITEGHKILYGSEQNTSDYGVAWGTNLPSTKFNTSTTNNNYTVVVKSGVTVDNVKIYPQLFDLTAMNREDITTVEQFKAEFPEFYPYENGNIYPAKISGVKFTGKNLFNYNWTRIAVGDVRNASIVEALGNGVILQGNKSKTPNDQYYDNGWFSPGYIYDKDKINIQAGDRVTISANYEILESDNTSATVGVHFYSSRDQSYTSLHSVKTKVLTRIVQTFTIMTNNSFHPVFTLNSNKVKITDIQIEISDAPTAYEPYTEPVSVTLPETYSLHGIGGYKDYLEITKNEDNELYTLKKVQTVEVNESEKTITPLETPVETVIATNLTYEQVTAIRHNGGLIEVEGNTNKGYARPTIKNTIVYRLTATNTAEV